MKLLVFLIFAIGVAHADETNLKLIAIKLNCAATLTGASSTELYCFRNDVIDPGQPTETRGCSIRRYDLEKKEFIGFPNRSEKNQFVIATQACETGGIESVLNLPINETSYVEDAIASIFDTSESLIQWGAEKSPGLLALTQKLNQTIQNNRRSKGAMRNAEPSAAPTPYFPPHSAAPRLSEHTNVQVFFGSDRQYLANKAPADTFLETRSTNSSLTLGTVSVSIPANHQFGKLELPEVYTLKMSDDPDRYVVLKSIERQDPGVFWNQLQNRVQRSPKKELFVFVHGFNVSFEEAAQRTAQMAYDLKFSGAPIFYSWPSETILRYTVAEKNVEWTLPHLTQFLKELSEKSGATEIHLVAHSMGNRALTNALNALAQARLNNASPMFKNVILAAPDVDQVAFRQIETSVRSTTSALTLYASKNDRALQISSHIHHGPRLGQTGENTLTSPLFDTIDASAVDVSFVGHSYYGDNPSVVSDMAHLLVDSMTAIQRPFLKAVQSLTGNSYWKLIVE